MTQKLSLSFSKTPKGKADSVVVFVPEKGGLLAEGGKLDKKTGGLLSSALQTRDTFKGKAGEAIAVILPKSSGYKQAVLVGLGGAEKLDSLTLETIGGRTLTTLKALCAQDVSVLFELPKTSVKADEAMAAYASGISTRDYAFDKYKQKKPKDKSGDSKKLKSITISGSGATTAASLFRAYENLAKGTCFARDLVNEAPNVLYPDSYAKILQKELKPLGVQVEIFDEKKMAKLGFEAHLAVGMGSARKPRVVIMRWNGTGKKDGTPLAFVGKGVTFDTGGISIKPAGGMEEMKMDMGGSAAVAGLIRTLAANKAKVDVVGVVGLAENMPSDCAYRPGDIIGSLAGKTIEVLNTDAEGRLVLCDALTYVQKTYKPRLIVDLATLTGAIMVALGMEYAGAFVNDDKLWGQLNKAATISGEKLWRMPLDEAYKNSMKGNVTDLQNLSSWDRYGGSCTAAGFLEHFIEDKTPWAHLDIAGTAWWKSDKALYPKGGTGFGVRLLYHFVKDNYAK